MSDEVRLVAVRDWRGGWVLKEEVLDFTLLTPSNPIKVKRAIRKPNRIQAERPLQPWDHRCDKDCDV